MILIEKEKTQLEKTIKEVLGEGIKKDFQPMVWHQVAVGGKRIRPALAIECCKLLGGSLKDVLYGAAGLEILHNYTLIVDDIIDNSLVRRNKPTTWVKYSTPFAQCVALYYSSAIFEATQRTKNSKQISEILAQVLKKITSGEIEDILFESNNRKEKYIQEKSPKIISQTKYFEMISLKTASLIEASCWVGGVCANGTPRQIQTLKEYGFNLGLAFQLQDDILDIFGDEKTFGKKIGKDIEERKRGNIILLLAGVKTKKMIEQIFQKAKISQTDIKKIIQELRQTKINKKAEKIAFGFSEKAIFSLGYLPNSKHKQNLIDLAKFVVARKK